MHKIILTAIVQLYAFTTVAQHTLYITVKDKEDSSLLTGATIVIPKLDKAFVADSSGVIQLNNLPDGNYKLAISCIGYAAAEYNLSLPSPARSVTILLEKEHDEDQEVVVTAPRLSRTIANIPT